MPTTVISVLDIRRISFYISQCEGSNKYLIFKSGNYFRYCKFEVLRPMFMKSDVLVTTLQTNISTQFVRTTVMF
jgi:hypothetical protein